MVNYGPSKGCSTCRKRRVKCDQAKPSCQNCSRLGRHCEGYGSVTKRPELRKILTPKTPRDFIKPKNTTISIPASIEPSDEITAVCFFLTSIVGLGRGLESSQGFLEPLLPVYAREKPSSVLSTVLSAVSTKIWGFFKDPTRSFDTPHAPFSKALGRLQKALNDPAESSKDSTVLGVILMHFYESLAARSMHRITNRAHQDGARALLDGRTDAANESQCGMYLRGYLRHCDVSTYIETQSLGSSDLDIWWAAGWNDSMPVNPNAALDMIGLSLAHMQRRLSTILVDLELTDSSLTKVRSWWQDMELIETQLSDWVRLVPGEWTPCQMTLDESVFTLDICDVYPTVQIASIWNVWRICRLMALAMKLHLRDHIHDHTLPAEQGSDGQDIVDYMCRSLPFYLGNRQGHGGLQDLVDPGIKVISYYDNAVDDAARQSYLEGGEAMSYADFRQHILVQGPSHALLHLNGLVRLLSSKGGSEIVRAVGADRVAWIHEQYLRVCRLTNPHLKELSIQKSMSTY